MQLYNDEDIDIESLIDSSRSRNSTSNSKEFIVPGDGSARTSTTLPSRPNKHHDNIKVPTALASSNIPDRISALQAHLNIDFANTLDIHARLRALEEYVMALEADYPTFAAFHFNQPRTGGLKAPLRSSIVNADASWTHSFEAGVATTGSVAGKSPAGSSARGNSREDTVDEIKAKIQGLKRKLNLE